MRKRYEVRGMMEWYPVFKVGRMRLQVSFTGGHLCGGGVTPARYETSDPVVQKIIEASGAYRNGTITGMVIGADGEEKEKEPTTIGNPSPDTQKKRVSGPVMEFSNLNAAADFLHYDKGFDIEVLGSKEICVEKARSIGIDLRFLS